MAAVRRAGCAGRIDVNDGNGGRPSRPYRDHSARGGFTLVELLVVIAILAIVTAMTVTAVNLTMTAERIRSAARQMQSYLEGARDRAIYADEPRGVRFLLDETLQKPHPNPPPSDPNATIPYIVSSMVFIGETEPYSEGMLRLERPDANSDDIADGPEITILRGNGSTGWLNLKQRGLLYDGTRIKIPADKNGTWYTVLTGQLTATNEVLELSVPYRDPGTTDTSQVIAFNRDQPNGFTWTYQLEMPPQVLPDQEPTLLPRGIVVDLDRSRLPPRWTLGGGAYSSQMDVMFSPRGFVTGPAASQGLVHFYLSELAVAEALGANLLPSGHPLLPPAIPGDSTNTDFTQPPFNLVGPIADALDDRLIATLFTRTGNISTHPVDATDSDADGLADDPFRFAETGEVAGQ